MDELQQSIEQLNQSIKTLGDRIDSQDAEIDLIKRNNETQDTQLQAANTALAAWKASRENKQAVKSLAEDFRDTTQIAAARIVALERLTATALRTIKAFIIAVGGYLLLEKSADLWATSSLFDDKLADWLSMSAIACFTWALVVISDKEQNAIDIIQSLPFFRK